MELQSFKIKVPGSLMLLGEHAVLHGENALCCAINKFIYINFTVRSDKKIIINSNIGKYITDLDNLSFEKNHKFNFILAAINLYKLDYNLSHGFDLNISSDFAHNIGFGSSAAVTVGMVYGLEYLVENYCSTSLRAQRSNPEKILTNSIKIIHQIQGMGSGADCAASLYGGIILYSADQKVIKKYNNKLDITAVYCGYKTKTADVIKIINSKNIDKSIYYSMGKAVNKLDNNLNNLPELFNLYYDLQDKLGTSDKVLAEIVYKLREDKNISASKISGSGLGDCVIGLGHTDYEGKTYFNLTTENQGAHVL